GHWILYWNTSKDQKDACRYSIFLYIKNLQRLHVMERTSTYVLFLMIRSLLEPRITASPSWTIMIHNPCEKMNLLLKNGSDRWLMRSFYSEKKAIPVFFILIYMVLNIKAMIKTERKQK